MEDNFDMENFLMLEDDQLDNILNNSRIDDQIMTVETQDLTDLNIPIGEEGIQYDVETFNKEVEEFLKVNPEAAKDVMEIKRMIESKMMQRSLGEDSEDDDVLDFDFKKYELDDMNTDELEYDKYKNVEIKEEDKSEGEEDLDLLGGDDDEINSENDDDEETNPFRLVFVNEENQGIEDLIVNSSPVDGKLKANKYDDAFNGEMISSKRGLEDLHFKKFDYSSGEEIKNMSFGFEEDDDDDEEGGFEKEEEDDDEEGLENENPFHPDNLFDMGQYEDADVDRYKKMITDLRNPESGPMFIYMGSCWMAGALVGTFRGFKKSLFRTPKRGWDRIFECFEYSKPIIERTSNLALRVGAVIGVSQLGLSFFFETNEYTRITSFGLGMLTYYKSFHPDLLSKAKMLTFFGLFSACCIGMHQLRRTFNGYNGAEPLITFLSLTTHNPFIRYFLDVKLGITDFFFPNFYGNLEDYSITSPFDLPVSTKQVQLLGAPKIEEDL